MDSESSAVPQSLAAHGFPAACTFLVPEFNPRQGATSRVMQIATEVGGAAHLVGRGMVVAERGSFGGLLFSIADL
jgi:hypothetical protein